MISGISPLSLGVDLESSLASAAHRAVSEHGPKEEPHASSVR